jgi:hypothetical protein
LFDQVFTWSGAFLLFSHELDNDYLGFVASREN